MDLREGFVCMIYLFSLVLILIITFRRALPAGRSRSDDERHRPNQPGIFAVCADRYPIYTLFDARALSLVLTADNLP